MKQWNLLVVFGIWLAFSANAAVAKTEKIYLSGSGAGDTREWQFYCSGGRNSGRWTSIEVPSQWEQEGFGGYTYGRFYLDKTAKPSDETGFYRCAFNVPEEWKGRKIKIVFEGVMTDAEVKVNGHSAGPTHQGGFTEFEYDITDLLHYGRKDNRLEVTVSKESADPSVNAAERRADWWLFGGIYRPVYLKVLPAIHIDRVALDPRADGSLNARVYTHGADENCGVKVELRALSDRSLRGSRSARLTGDSTSVSTVWRDVKTWDVEHPNLYEVKFVLIDADGNEIHEISERVGFRTVEFRRQDGIYLNGTRLIIKGVNRHCFSPETGRTLNRDMSLADALLIKEMNMNAVRSHYPPDRHFLEICDSIGLLYLDEFTGWHGKYDTRAGLPLLREFIARDVNHPCVFLWSNGNEGGWNTSLDGMFANLDPQCRHVVHPWGDFDGIDTHHYPSYQTGPGKLANGWKVFMPTEFLHSRYDKGGGAGLEDFWSNYRRNPMFAGGFIWAFADEAVARADRGGQLDSYGSNGPDGIVGPHREKEGSFYTIRDVWAPVQFAPFNVTSSFDGTMLVTNDYLFTNFDECSMVYRTYTVSDPAAGGEKVLVDEGEVTLPSIAPGETGRARFMLPADFADTDIFEVEMFGPDGRSVVTRTWPVKFASAYHESHDDGATTAVEAAPTAFATDGRIVLENGDVKAVFRQSDGCLMSVESHGRIVPLADGPRPVGMRASVRNTNVRVEGDEAILNIQYRGGIDSIVWRLRPDGMLAMDAVILDRPESGRGGERMYDEYVTDLGLTFSYPEEKVTGMKWLGRGPYRVWKNRQRGASFGLWQKTHNNTVTGHSYEALIYPEFKGYHGMLYWATLEGNDGSLTVKSKTDGLFMRVFTPDEPEGVGKDDRMPEMPDGDISFLIDINAMRSFKPVSEHGPLSQPSKVRIKSGDEGIAIRLCFKFD